MGEDRPAYSLKAPGAPGSSLHLPGRGSFPPLDEHLVEPEVTRDEIIEGRRVVAMPAREPHADQHGELQFVLRAHVAPGYLAAVDLLTRFDFQSDFATDVCVRRAGIDPQTGTRYLEELAFEVVSKQNERDVLEKAQVMHRRGVRRIFALFVKGKRRVCEWSAENRSWRVLDPSSHIEDPCLAMPLQAAALLDAAAANQAVVEALAAQDDPAIRRREAAARSEGKAAGRAEAVLDVLEARGIAVSQDQRQEILRCDDLERLGRWLRRAALASSADEVLQE
ncbi:MAG TPA: Uma2 family endonuclease [Chloroflexia bacterium]